MVAVADFDFVRATLAGEGRHKCTISARVRRTDWEAATGRHHAKPAIAPFSLWETAQIADTAVIKVGLATLSLAMVRVIQNAT
jgi:hypothetical protein